MKSLIRRAIVKLAQKISPSIKAKLHSIPYVAKFRELIYHGSGIEPFLIPGLPFDLVLYVNLENPAERTFVVTHYEPHVVQYLLHTIKDGWVTFDIGAYIGFYSMLLGKLCGPHGRVIAFEPIESLQNRILLSAKANKLANIHVESLAVGESSGMRKLWIHEDVKGYFGTSSSLVRSKGKLERVVKMISIDEYICLNQLSRVDFIKIDVEGAEIEVLKGAKKTLKQFNPIVLIEFNTAEDLEHGKEFLSSVGYVYKEIGFSSYGVHIVAFKKSRSNKVKTTIQAF
jgi:methyltransferase, FkbM family